MKKVPRLGLITMPVIPTGIVVASSAYAQANQAGDTALSTLEGMVTGNLGLMVGLGIMILGLLTLVLGGKAAAGLTMMLGGAIFTFAPGIFNGVRDMVYGVVEQFSNGNPTRINGSSWY